MLAPKSVAAQETWTLLVDSWSSSAAAAGAAKTAKTSIRSSSSRLLETRHEARNILQQAIVLERRLERSDKRSIDFIAYAQFCAKLIDLFKLRQKISDLKIELFLAAKRDLVMLANRAFRIYIFRNQGDYEMWKAYLDFNKEFVIYYPFCLCQIFNSLQGSKKQISKIYARILNIHSLNIEAIREAIEWEFIDMKNFETARGLLQKYLDRDPTNSILWSTYLQLEISFVETLNKDKRFGSNLGVTSENLNELMQGSLVREVAKEIRNNSILQVRIDSSKFSKKIATEFSEVLDESW
ncbi:MAG: U3 snoRNP protein [Marteilia pararefringens]